MLRDNLQIFLSIIVCILAIILVNIVSSIVTPFLALWTIVLLFYYPYAKICKRFFKNSKAYSGCWRRLYRYVHFKDRLINKIFK